MNPDSMQMHDDVARMIEDDSRGKGGFRVAIIHVIQSLVKLINAGSGER